MASSGRSNLIASVDRTIDVLEALGQAERGLRLSELSRRVGLPHSTVHRILSTLRHRDFVAQDEVSQAYHLSTRILALQANIAGNLSLVEKAIPVMNRLAKEVGASSHLAMLGDTEVLYLESRRSSWVLNSTSPSRRVAPAYCTALGKVLLAFLPRDELDARLGRMQLQRRTPHTITDKQELIAHLAHVRETGYALDLQENFANVTCVAAPIRDHAGTVIAAISLAAPSQDPQELWVSDVLPLVLAGANEISRFMGWQDAQSASHLGNPRR